MGAKMRGVLRAGVLYFTIIFVIGFALGTIRVLLLVPRLGAVTSELIELPIILTAAWILCDRLITHLQVSRHWWARLSMGAIAFTLLMMAEAVLSVGSSATPSPPTSQAIAPSTAAWGYWGRSFLRPSRWFKSPDLT
jgi:hypothetical protein